MIARMQPALRLIIALTALVGSPHAPAEETGIPALSLHGFGTLGIARSDNGNADFVRDLSQPKGSSGNGSALPDSLFGVQANYHLGDQFETVVQGVSHHRYDHSFRPEATWAFLKYEPNAATAFRLGRFGTEFFMLADSRMVGYSYLTVRPPGDYFGPLPLNYVDGLHGRFTGKLGESLIRAELYTGLAREKLPAKDDVLDMNGSRLNGISLDLQHGPWQTRLSQAQISLEHGVATLDALGSRLIATGVPAAIATGQGLQMAGSITRYRSIGIIYDDGRWQAHLDYNVTTHSNLNYQNSRSGYVLLGRRVGKLTPFAGYSWTHSSPKPMDTGLADPAANAQVAQVIAWSHQNQHTFMAGSRWDFRHNLDLKVQLDLQRGAADSVALVQNAGPGWNGHSNILSMALDFVF